MHDTILHGHVKQCSAQNTRIRLSIIASTTFSSVKHWSTFWKPYLIRISSFTNFRRSSVAGSVEQSWLWVDCTKQTTCLCLDSIPIEVDIHKWKSMFSNIWVRVDRNCRVQCIILCQKPEGAAKSLRLPDVKRKHADDAKIQGTNNHTHQKAQKCVEGYSLHMQSQHPLTPVKPRCRTCSRGELKQCHMYY